jgi:hypothetical protein
MSRRIRDIVGPAHNAVFETVETTGNALVGGTLAVSGNHNVTGDLAVTGTATFSNALTGEGVGTVTTVSTTAVEEHGDGLEHLTKLTFTAFVVHATEPDNEDLAVGAKFYTLPAGAFMIENASLIGSFLKTGEATIADGEVAIGTLIGSTAVDTTGEVDAAAENVLGPIVLSNTEFDGAAIVTGITAANLYIAAAGGLARDLFLNIAATWPDVDPSGGITFTGVITLKWRKIN